MRELYIFWCTLICFLLISSNAKGISIFGALFDDEGGGGSYGSGSYGRGWGYGSGGGFHK